MARRHGPKMIRIEANKHQAAMAAFPEGKIVREAAGKKLTDRQVTVLMAVARQYRYNNQRCGEVQMSVERFFEGVVGMPKEEANLHNCQHYMGSVTRECLDSVGLCGLLIYHEYQVGVHYRLFAFTDEFAVKYWQLVDEWELSQPKPAKTFKAGASKSKSKSKSPAKPKSRMPAKA